VLHTTYLQLGDLQVRLNAVVGRREMVTSEATVSAKDKKKSKTDRDKRSEVRTSSDKDKDKEALEWAIKRSQAGERRAAKVKAKEDKEMTKVLEQSRLEAEIAAKELKTLSCTPADPTPLLILGSRSLVVCDVHGNMHASAAPLVSSQRPPFLPDSEELRAMFAPPKHRHVLSRPLDRSSESKDSRAPDALEKKSSEFTLTR
jgi:hypothetical protein